MYLIKFDQLKALAMAEVDGLLVVCKAGIREKTPKSGNEIKRHQAQMVQQEMNGGLLWVHKCPPSIPISENT